jgi:hypothetical protein
MGVVGVVLAEYKGQTYKKDDLVHIFVGTEAGVRAKKTEPLVAKFKGVKDDLFLCRPVVGWISKGKMPGVSEMVGQQSESIWFESIW